MLKGTPSRLDGSPRIALLGAILLLPVVLALVLTFLFPLSTPASADAYAAVQTTEWIPAGTQEVSSTLIISDAGWQAGAQMAYVPLANSNRLALVDTVSHFFASIDLGTAGCSSPRRVAISPSGEYVYVSCNYSDNVAVIDTASNTVVVMVSWIPDAEGITFIRDGAYALVGSSYSNQIVVIDTATYFIRIIPTPDESRSIVAHPYLPRAYATCANGTILVIDTTSFEIVATIPVGDEPWDVAVPPDGQWLFVSDRYGDGLVVIDPHTNAVHTTVTDLGNLAGLEISPDGATIYACGQSNGIRVIDRATLDLLTTIPATGNDQQAAATCDGNELYVVNGSDQIAVLSLDTYSMTDRIWMPGAGTSDVAICPQYVATGIHVTPPSQANSGARGQMVTHQATLVNTTGTTDTFSLALGSHSWDTTLSTPAIGPLADGDWVTFSVHVTVPWGVAWYNTDTVAVTATSIASPTIYSDTGSFETQAYAPPSIAVSPDYLTSTQLANETVDMSLTISNGNGVTLAYEINYEQTGDRFLENRLEALNTNYQAVLDAIPNRYDFSDGSTGYYIYDGGYDMYDYGNYLSTDLGGNIYYADNTVVDSTYFGPTGRYFTRKYPGLFVLVADMDDVNYFQISGGLGADGSGNVDGTVLQTNGFGTSYYGFVKRVYNAGDPSVNHLIIVPGNPSIDHQFSSNTDNDYHQIYNLSGTRHLYYLLYAGTSGHYIDNAATLEIMETFLQALMLSTPETWLSVDPVSGTVPSQSAVPIQVTLDARSVQPGVHSTVSYVYHNDPVTPSVVIPVTMTVLPTASMGWVEGTITDVGTGEPLAATVVAQGQPYTVTTDPGTGTYKLWLNAGSYDLQAAAIGYVSATTPVDIVAQQGTNQDLALERYVPRIGIAPLNLESIQGANTQATKIMTITNDGPKELEFEIEIDNLEKALEALNANYQAVIDAIPNRFDFSDGTSGYSIYDGGYDMYDSGNYLSTDLGGNIYYSNDTVVDSTYFGPTGRYFTRKYPGLFVLVADMEGVDSFQISGNLGADGSGNVDGTVLRGSKFGVPYRGFVKRVYGADVPSVNHLIIVPDNYSAAHGFSSDTSNDYHQVYNLSGTKRLYYLLYAGTYGHYIDDDATLEIMKAFLAALGPSPADSWLSVEPVSGTVPARSSLPVRVTFDARGVQSSTYSTTMLVWSTDLNSPTITVTATMVTGPARVFLPCVWKTQE